jgi:hypothetical protein
MLSLFYQLPNCNLFTQHVLFILWRDTTSELWTPDLFPSYCYHLFTLLALFFARILLLFSARYAHTLCFKQTGEIDNLIESWEQSTWLCCVQVPCCCSQSKAWTRCHINCLELSRSLQALPSVVLAFSSSIDKPWFLTEGKTCYCA